MNSLFIVDDDPRFCAQLRRLATRENIHLVCYNPVTDFHSLPLDGEFDVALIDYDLGGLVGPQIAALYSQTPVVLISTKNHREEADDTWPLCIRSFVRKANGLQSILDEARRIGNLDERYSL